jgi:predicted nucleic acid-binding protein
MLYLDTSAVVKLIRREPETDALADWLDDHQPTPWVSSTLVEVELPRALRRTDSSLLTRVPAVIARIARYEIDDVVRAAAAAFPDPELRSLDAIHLATATAIFARSLIAFVCYDQRLLSAATAVRLPVESPGTESPSAADTPR